MRQRSKMRTDPGSTLRKRVARKATPVSSHPEIEEEIERLGCALDERRLNVEIPRPKVKPIVSVDGHDLEEMPFRKNRAA